MDACISVSVAGLITDTGVASLNRLLASLNKLHVCEACFWQPPLEIYTHMSP